MNKGSQSKGWDYSFKPRKKGDDGIDGIRTRPTHEEVRKQESARQETCLAAGETIRLKGRHAGWTPQEHGASRHFVAHTVVTCTCENAGFNVDYFALRRDDNILRHIFLNKISSYCFKIYLTKVQNVIYCYTVAPLLFKIIYYLPIRKDFLAFRNIII